jgi:uncharacterized protein YndB with AHSA1/START domain
MDTKAIVLKKQIPASQEAIFEAWSNPEMITV